MSSTSVIDNARQVVMDGHVTAETDENGNLTLHWAEAETEIPLEDLHMAIQWMITTGEMVVTDEVVFGNTYRVEIVAEKLVDCS